MNELRNAIRQIAKNYADSTACISACEEIADWLHNSLEDIVDDTESVEEVFQKFDALFLRDGK